MYIHPHSPKRKPGTILFAAISQSRSKADTFETKLTGLKLRSIFMHLMTVRMPLNHKRTQHKVNSVSDLDIEKNTHEKKIEGQ